MEEMEFFPKTNEWMSLDVDRQGSYLNEKKP